MTRKISESNIQTTTLESLSGGGGSGTTAYDTIAELPLSGVEDGEMALVLENNRLYIWNGTGWFNIALLNTNPTITSGPNASYVLAKDGTPTVLTLVASDPEGLPIFWSSQVTSGTLGNTAVITQNNNVFTITPSTDSDDIGVFSVTFVASDGVNIATAVSSFTLVFSAVDTRYNQSILLTTSSVNNANNNTFIDSSNNNFAITRNGNATQGTFSPHSPAGWSGFFDGTGDNLLINYNSALHLSNDFTIECWFYANAHGGMILNFAGGLNIAWASYELVSNADGINFAASSDNSGYNIGSETGATGRIGTVQLGTWNHLAVTRSGNIYRGFVNGTQGYTQTLALTPYNPNARGLAIGGNYATTWGTGTPTSVVNGYISNLRVVKGTALYTANFTPPTEPLAVISNTSLLTCADNRFIDRSTNNFAITRFGDTRITPFSPFIPTAEYSPSIHGGSAYFDGTGDFLSTTGGAGLSLDADFTIDFWMNPSSLAISGTMSNGETSFLNNAAAFIISHGTASNRLSFWVNNISASGFLVASTTTLAVGQWFHIALSRQSGTLRLFVNGILEATRLSSTGTVNLISNGLLNVGRYWGGSFTGFLSNIRIVKGTAVYTANFTPPTAPVTAVANTSLLLNFTNAGVFDETGKVVLETVGNARASTAVAKYGATSMFFDGTGDYLTVPDDAALQMGTGNFTIEFWINFLSIASYQSVYDKGYTGAGALLFQTGLGNGRIVIYASGSAVIIESGIAPTSTWIHYALVRNGSTLTLYRNGVSSGSATNSTNFNNTTNLAIGTSSTAAPGGIGIYPVNGYIQDLRITKGHARYTANFTPPTAKLGYSNAE